MNYSDGFNQSMYDGDIDINITNQNLNDNTNTNTMGFAPMGGMPMGGNPMMGMTTCPVVETPRERVVYRSFLHTVPQEW